MPIWHPILLPEFLLSYNGLRSRRSGHLEIFAHGTPVVTNATIGPDGLCGLVMVGLDSTAVPYADPKRKRIVMGHTTDILPNSSSFYIMSST
ncbi:protein of unknown function [Petrocella atlantisensis]|uniref:Uncharacterized protein n=1 Tax=Petrocella atlantisensis TaxID=2173034 RepID=A0A3P7RVD5_9FIRM|nr:protein of unknown function [Petrocella atlantisensis]